MLECSWTLRRHRSIYQFHSHQVLATLGMHSTARWPRALFRTDSEAILNALSQSGWSTNSLGNNGTGAYIYSKNQQRIMKQQYTRNILCIYDLRSKAELSHPGWNIFKENNCPYFLVFLSIFRLKLVESYEVNGNLLPGGSLHHTALFHKQLFWMLGYSSVQ